MSYKHKSATGIAPILLPKDAVQDHWTWRDGVPHVTGWHRKQKAKPEVEEHKPSGRGIVEPVRATRIKPVQDRLL